MGEDKIWIFVQDGDEIQNISLDKAKIMSWERALSPHPVKYTAITLYEMSALSVNNFVIDVNPLVQFLKSVAPIKIALECPLFWPAYTYKYSSKGAVQLGADRWHW